MPLSIPETQSRIDRELNRPGQPFHFWCRGEEILGTWNIADVSYTDLLGGGTIDKAYSITVTLDAGTGTYSFTERTSDSQSSFGMNPDGTAGYESSHQAFKGKTVSKQWGGGFTLGSATSNGRAGQSWSWSFETSRIKEPLLALLQDAGWEPARKGFLSRLFSH